MLARYRARWILPVEGEPVENGTIEIDDAGRIAAVHAACDVRAEDLGNVAVVPGLINVHTHLEFSDLVRPLEPAEPFADWIRALVEHRRGRSEPVAEIVRRGIAESGRCGTTLLGEIATSDLTADEFPAHSPRVVVFRELLGRLPEQVEGQLEIARRHLTRTDGVLCGLSPHAPYSIHPELYRGLVRLAAESGAPLAIHLAETRAELELLDRGSGELVEMLRSFGVWRDGVLPTGMRPLDYLRELDAVSHALLVHGNYLDAEEIDFIAGRENLTVVYCPRTHAYFGHAAHPWLELLERGGRVALGTDSRASNPDLSLWKELRFLRRTFPRLDPARLLKLGTLAGAAALGLESETGSLVPGKRADLAVVPFPDHNVSEPYSEILNSARVARTMIGGKWLP